MTVTSARAQGPAEGFRVIELYTAQGCPACPAGDRVFDRLAQDRNTIALGCHVTYFDRGWKDSMSRIFCDARQGAYRESGVASKVYTPQLIINGRAEVVASREADVSNALARSPALPTISLKKNQDYLDITLPPMTLTQPVDVWLFGYDNAQDAKISGGANRGKTVSYAHPVTNITKLLSWKGAPVKMSFPVSNYNGDHFAVVAQYPDSQIIAAGKTQ